jgi:hypothetical protein
MLIPGIGCAVPIAQRVGTITANVQDCYLPLIDRRAKLVTVTHITVVLTNKASRTGRIHLLPIYIAYSLVSSIA